LNRQLAAHLFDFLKQDDRFEPILAHDLSHPDQEFIPELAKYFEEEREDIQKWGQQKRSAMKRLVNKGKVEDHEGVVHNVVSEDVGVQLYGINKWAGENNIDLLLHIHFNDHPGRGWNKPGKYSGFNLYVPESQLLNAKVTAPIAHAIFSEMKKYVHVSDFPGERAGVVEDQDLIAIGSSNTLTIPSILIEYGYIYESQFHAPFANELFKDMAFHTYRGLNNYVTLAHGGYGINRPNTAQHIATETVFLPHTWKEDLERGLEDHRDVLALQTVLHRDGVYPGAGKTLNDCPINGSFGPCTQAALRNFQEKYNIEPTGFVGPKTRAFLNAVYGS
jgi:hypothetical protein